VSHIPPAPLHATPADLPPAVAAALAMPAAGRPLSVHATERRWSALGWGDTYARPLLLIHGVTSCAETWWRTAPALAATGRRVVAVDLPGHGDTGDWTGRHRFRDTAAEVAAFAHAARLADVGLTDPGLQIVGHSWGAMIAAALPAAGLRPATLVLLDPPAIPVDVISAMLHDPIERPYDDLAEATAAIAGAHPDWTAGDVHAKALGLTRVDPEAARAVLVDNGDWDGGLSALKDEAAAGLAVWVIRGEERTGSMLPDAALGAFVAQVGAERVLTIADGPHSPHRTHPEATLVALLRALG
jgi:pimeloyl-ACP methyl ester carboxylesterase